eukprot:NODE_9033_length_626_cov_9.713718_g8405_i0.p1 GENE.NODE_9033_length_626_cov_9.713718_g8405_i0~~NODE_9033_length_626_cov_9.713718_g8405_i0.p1  ORF type:complete len:176 (+),score=16.43 NODE_9033_length_626_cov_9.713718_g8405_i0:58-528(+)
MTICLFLILIFNVHAKYQSETKSTIDESNYEVNLLLNKKRDVPTQIRQVTQNTYQSPIFNSSTQFEHLNHKSKNESGTDSDIIIFLVFAFGICYFIKKYGAMILRSIIREIQRTFLIMIRSIASYLFYYLIITIVSYIGLLGLYVSKGIGGVWLLN